MSAGNDVKSVLLGYLEEARIDLMVFKLLSIDSNEGVRRRALFHLQQASEKLAKTHVYYVMSIICMFILDAQAKRDITKLAKKYKNLTKKCKKVIPRNREMKTRETVIEFLKKGYGHNAGALVDLEQELRNLLKERPNVVKHTVTQLIEKAMASLLRELSEKEREKLEQSIRNLFSRLGISQSPSLIGAWRIMKAIISLPIAIVNMIMGVLMMCSGGLGVWMAYWVSSIG
jgi:hypothetical protein